MDENQISIINPQHIQQMHILRLLTVSSLSGMDSTRASAMLLTSKLLPIDTAILADKLVEVPDFLLIYSPKNEARHVSNHFSLYERLNGAEWRLLDAGSASDLQRSDSPHIFFHGFSEKLGTLEFCAAAFLPFHHQRTGQSMIPFSV